MLGTTGGISLYHVSECPGDRGGAPTTLAENTFRNSPFDVVFNAIMHNYTINFIING